MADVWQRYTVGVSEFHVHWWSVKEKVFFIGSECEETNPLVISGKNVELFYLTASKG